jgi:hypothetical protein
MNSLDETDRRILEDMISSCAVWLPEWMPEYRKEESKKVWNYDNPEDFVLGLAVGMIYAHFEDYIVTMHRRELDPSERTEIMTTILLQTSYIRKALFGNEAGSETGTGIG